MNLEFINIYNNLVNLSRNKNIYYFFTNNDTFSDRLLIFLFHLGFFLKIINLKLAKNTCKIFMTIYSDK